MEFEEFEQAVIFAFVGANVREMEQSALMRLVFSGNATMSIRARAIHDEGQKQAALFLSFMQKLEDHGLVRRTAGAHFAGDHSSEEALPRYTLTNRVGFGRMGLAKS